uniref:Uncharacterized protein n=1 Tax=Myotis myotis TaxID=51298 RepID=A0A7J7WVX0_MYOMY|nr:hypothetical protein mMyoMyo1_011879 [Myotis myotis]
MVSPAVGQAHQGPRYKPQVGSRLGPKTPRTCGREAAGEGMKAAARGPSDEIISNRPGAATVSAGLDAAEEAGVREVCQGRERCYDAGPEGGGGAVGQECGQRQAGKSRETLPPRALRGEHSPAAPVLALEAWVCSAYRTKMSCF